MADSADESLKFLFSENRIMHRTILLTFTTKKSKWQIYCFNLVFSLNQGPKSDLPLPSLSDGLWSDTPLNASFYSRGSFYEQIAPSPFGSRYDPISKQKHSTHLLALEEENYD